MRVLEKLLSVSYLTLMASEYGSGGREKLMLCIQNQRISTISCYLH